DLPGSFEGPTRPATAASAHGRNAGLGRALTHVRGGGWVGLGAVPGGRGDGGQNIGVVDKHPDMGLAGIIVRGVHVAAIPAAEVILDDGARPGVGDNGGGRAERRVDADRLGGAVGVPLARVALRPPRVVLEWVVAGLAEALLGALGRGAAGHLSLGVGQGLATIAAG